MWLATNWDAVVGFTNTQHNIRAEFTPWVEKELGCSDKYAQRLLAVANLPSPDELKTGVHPRFTLNIDELAAAGRAVKRGIEPQAASLPKVLMRKATRTRIS